MVLFKRGKSIPERFSPERLGALAMLLSAGAHSAASKAGHDRSQILTSKFFTGYLLAYPTYLDDIDKLVGASIRRGLFLSIYGTVEGDEIYQKTLGHLMLSDAQVPRVQTLAREMEKTSFKP